MLTRSIASRRVVLVSGPARVLFWVWEGVGLKCGYYGRSTMNDENQHKNYHKRPRVYIQLHYHSIFFGGGNFLNFFIKIVTCNVYGVFCAESARNNFWNRIFKD